MQTGSVSLSDGRRQVAAAAPVIPAVTGRRMWRTGATGDGRRIFTADGGKMAGTENRSEDGDRAAVRVEPETPETTVVRSVPGRPERPGTRIGETEDRDQDQRETQWERRPRQRPVRRQGGGGGV